MVNRNLERQFDVPEAELRAEDPSLFEGAWLEPPKQSFSVNRLVTGRVFRIVGDNLVLDIGAKSMGAVPRAEWEAEGADPSALPKIGDEVVVFLQSVDDANGSIVLSYRKGQRFKEWQRFASRHKLGDAVAGPVVRAVKGGLLIDVGATAFLPARLIDFRLPRNLEDYVGKTIEAAILTLDEERQRIILSRRKLMDHGCPAPWRRRRILETIQPGEVRKGVVKNIADFGAFVDLGGIDGLLHITDMAWERLASPHAVVKIDQEIEVMVLRVDRTKEKIALGLKQMQPSPWLHVAAKYRVGGRHEGEVVSVVSYGAFVKLEPGVEGLVHISEMSWTKRLQNAGEFVQVGDSIEVQVLAIDLEKVQIALGMRQLQPNPWDGLPERYPIGAIVAGAVRGLTNYGAFVELEEGVQGLIHVNDMEGLRPSDLLARGDEIVCEVISMDRERRRIALRMRSSPREQ